MDRFSLSSLSAAALCLCAAWPATAQDLIDPERPYDCTLDNVAGVYGFNEDTPSGTVTGESIAFVGILELGADGYAAIQFNGFLERGGPGVTSDVFEGTWEVEPNCLGLIDFETFETPGGSAESDYAFVAVENATELFLIRNNPLEEADAKLLFRR